MAWWRRERLRVGAVRPRWKPSLLRDRALARSPLSHGGARVCRRNPRESGGCGGRRGGADYGRTLQRLHRWAAYLNESVCGSIAIPEGSARLVVGARLVGDNRCDCTGWRLVARRVGKECSK